MSFSKRTQLSILPFYFLLVGLVFNGNAQHSKPTLNHQDVEKSNTITSNSAIKTAKAHSAEIHEKKDWHVSVKNLGIDHEGPNSQLLDSIKQAKLAKKKPANANNGMEGTFMEKTKQNKIDTPLVGTNFSGNRHNGFYPPDNNMAISNNGIIVSVVNSNIEYYNSQGNYLMTNTSLTNFFSSLNPTSIIFDPVVLYDSGADRFIVVSLHGKSPSNSKVFVAFSKTNNPLDGWWQYEFTGNPLNNSSSWFDYPKIAVSNKELFITGNLFGNNNFQEPVIYQFNKKDGYNGNSVNWQYWYNIEDGNDNTPFTLVPASYGHQGNYGPGMLFVSNSRSGGAEVQAYNLTDTLGGNPSIASYAVSVNYYTPAADAVQPGTNDLLDNGDCRILDAFYLDSLIHFVFHSEFQNTGYNGINYNRLNVVTLDNTSSTFGLDGYDYSYPSIASFSNTKGGRSVMINFLRSGGSVYPQTRVVNCDHSMNWSPSSLVKQGDDYVDIKSGKERWGDYTGISRKHNSNSPVVWLAGCFSTSTQTGFSNVWNTWVAEIKGSNQPNVGIKDRQKKQNSRIFPNPIRNKFSLEFHLNEKKQIKVELTDMAGKLVKTLYKGVAKEGDNLLTFNKGVLADGTYILTIKDDQKIIQNEKIIISSN